MRTEALWLLATTQRNCSSKASGNGSVKEVNSAVGIDN